MRVLVCGGRDYKDRKFLFETLDLLDRHMAMFDVVIHGAATGADALANAWAEERRIPVLEFRARWDDLNAKDAVIRRSRNGRLYNANAGRDRNWRMLIEGRPDVVIGFPGGNGTRHMLGIAREYSIDQVIEAGWRSRA